MPPPKTVACKPFACACVCCLPVCLGPRVCKCPCPACRKRQYRTRLNPVVAKPKVAEAWEVCPYVFDFKLDSPTPTSPAPAADVQTNGSPALFEFVAHEITQEECVPTMVSKKQSTTAVKSMHLKNSFLY